mmetsp:Transcript_8786/g.20737  ORF Transcript_8786/g.20737 Transcript_8786/m.20737 type:complete len:232 (+) Transcript_8786:160-855(+)
MRDIVLSDMRLLKPLPISLEMQTACWRYAKSGSRTASKQNAARSARLMAPASPSITFTTPLGAPSFRPPGRKMQNSRSAPGPSKKRFSCAFLSSIIFCIMVFIRILKVHGAWSMESPTPTDDTTVMRLTPYFLHASMICLVPSWHSVSPTSRVLPPSATTTPVISLPSKTSSTSARLSTEPSVLTILSGTMVGVKFVMDPFVQPNSALSRGAFNFTRSRTRQLTFSPRSIA